MSQTTLSDIYPDSVEEKQRPPSSGQPDESTTVDTSQRLPEGRGLGYDRGESPFQRFANTPLPR
jgi:hypothetical protein